MANFFEVDTEILRSAVSSAEQTNEEINEALNYLNQIVIHNDWACAEREVINENTRTNRQTAQTIHDNTNSFYQAVKLASQKFDEVEQRNIQNTNLIDDIIGSIINIVPGISAAGSIQITSFDGLQNSLEG